MAAADLLSDQPADAARVELTTGPAAPSRRRQSQICDSFSSGNGGMASGLTAMRSSNSALSSPALRLAWIVPQALALVDQHPFAVTPDGYGDGLH